MGRIFIGKILIIIFWSFLLVVSTYFYFENVIPYFKGSSNEKITNRQWVKIVHFIAAACTLFLGPLQFWPFIRNRFKKWHRRAGKVYIGGSIISALMVFYLLADYQLPGAVPSLGFLAVIWLFTIVAAFWFATKKNFKLHKQFMIRSYVCALAFVFIRLLPYINEYTGLFNFIENTEMKGTVYEWICWVYPLMITEFLLIWWPSIKKQRVFKK